MRNVLIAAGNSADASLVPPIEALLGHEAPVVRGAAVWALSRLVSRAQLMALAEKYAHEADEAVREEWSVALVS